MKYTIISTVTKYGISEIKPFVESIRASGYDGEKLMIVYDVSSEVIDYLHHHDWIVIQSELHQHIVLQRFRDTYAVLLEHETDIVIWVDARDLVFQRNPVEWLAANMKNDVLAFSESIKHKDENWAITNSGTSFPLEWEWLQHEEVYCAGTIVGKRNAIRDLFIEIYRWSMTGANPDQLADQAAYNILLRLYGWNDKIQFVKQQSGFVTHLHVKLKGIGDVPFTEEPAKIVGDEVVTSAGTPFVIIHQYDRDEKFKALIERKYT